MTLYLGRIADCSVFLKVIRVQLHHQDHTLDTKAVLNDGSEQTVLLSTAADKLGHTGHPRRTTLENNQAIHTQLLHYRPQQPRLRHQILSGEMFLRQQLPAAEPSISKGILAAARKATTSPLIWQVRDQIMNQQCPIYGQPSPPSKHSLTTQLWLLQDRMDMQEAWSKMALPFRYHLLQTSACGPRSTNHAQCLLGTG